MNGDGKILLIEFGEVFKILGFVIVDEVGRMMVEIDIDGDSFILFEEFINFVRVNCGLIKDVVKIF